MFVHELIALSPLVVLAAAALVTLLVVAFGRGHFGPALSAFAGFVLAGAALSAPLSLSGFRRVPPLLVLDGYALFFMALFFAAGAAIVLLSYGYLERRGGRRGEFYVLLLLATLGASVLSASDHFASLFLGLETLSVSLYGMIAYLRTERRGVEAGIKYLVLAAVSSAFLLFGMALIYADLGTMEFGAMAGRLGAAAHGGALFLPGLALLFTGVGFKLALVPFHMWTPDVYEGAPAPATAFVATVSKGGMFALLLRFWTAFDLSGSGQTAIFAAFAVIAVASMLAGNLLALLQKNVKRLLAYSSIAHLGYLLVALLAGGELATEAISYYLVSYFVMTLIAFGVIAVLSDAEGEAVSLSDYQGLFWRRPWLAAVFAAALLSLAGIPLTAGFMAKIYVLAAGVGAALWTLAILLVASSVIGLYYYLRVILVMVSAPADGQMSAAVGADVPVASGLVLGVLALLLIGLGVYPSPLQRVLELASRSFFLG